MNNKSFHAFNERCYFPRILRTRSKNREREREKMNMKLKFTAYEARELENPLP
jgi:hypothetical protein